MVTLICHVRLKQYSKPVKNRKNIASACRVVVAKLILFLFGSDKEQPKFWCKRLLFIGVMIILTAAKNFAMTTVLHVPVTEKINNSQKTILQFELALYFDLESVLEINNSLFKRNTLGNNF